MTSANSPVARQVSQRSFMAAVRSSLVVMWGAKEKYLGVRTQEDDFPSTAKYVRKAVTAGGRSIPIGNTEGSSPSAGGDTKNGRSASPQVRIRKLSQFSRIGNSESDVMQGTVQRGEISNSRGHRDARCGWNKERTICILVN